MVNLIDFIWPLPTWEKDEDRKKREGMVSSTAEKIHKQDWSMEIDTSLEEARSIYLAEDDRRKYADQKASIYLTVIAAIVPFSLPFVSEIWRGNNVLVSTPARISFFFSFMLALAYLLGGAWWSFRAISVSGYHRVDVEDLLRCWSLKRPKSMLTKKLLCASMYNRFGTNEKITKSIIAHQFLMRAIVLFIISTFIAVAGDEIYSIFMSIRAYF